MSKKSKTVLIVAGGILLIVLLCCCAVAVYFYPPVFNSLNSNSFTNKSNKFLSAISQKNYSVAFDSLTSELKGKVEKPENLPSYIGFKSAVVSFSYYKSIGLDFQTKEMGEIWKINFEDKSDAYLWIFFKDENHNWNINRFELRK